MAYRSGWLLMGVIVGLISELVKQVMQAHDLKQAEMAEVLGASLSRVKAITSGRVQKLKREETEALITKLHVRGDWLATGEGPMQQSGKEREFYRRLGAVKTATGKTGAVGGMSPEDKGRLTEILFHAELGNAGDLHDLLNPLAPDEQALLDSYRRCTPQARQHLIQTAALLSAGVAPTGQGAAGISQTQSGGSGVQQVFSAPVHAPVAGRDVLIDSTKGRRR